MHNVKVLILTEGGKNIGFGHITRCVALYQAFKEKGIVSELIMNGDNFILNLLRNREYQIYNWLEEQDKLLRNINKVDIIIIDSYLAPKSLYERVSKLTDGRTVSIDDYNRLEYPKGIVVNPSIYGNKLDYPKKKGLVYLLGKNYIILRKEFWSLPKKKVNKEVKNVLITFGGMDHSLLAKKIINCLKKNFDCSFYIVDPKKKRLTAKNMLNLILKADICISNGGQSTYELARCAIPTIGICFANNQLLNLKGLAGEGSLIFAGWHNDKNLFKEINDAIMTLDYRTRYSMSQIGEKLVDGQGAKRVVSEILK